LTLIAIRNGVVVTMDRSRTVHRPGTVLVDGSRIAAVGSSGAVSIPADATEIDATGSLVLPGFVNAHAHSSGILLRGGPARPRGFLDWLFNITYPGLAAFTPDDTHCAALLYALEAITAGITTIVDNRDPSRPSEWDAHMAATVSAYSRVGIRAACCQMFYDAPLSDRALSELLDQVMDAAPSVRHEGWSHWTTASAIVPQLGEPVDTGSLLGRIEQLIRRFDGSADGRVRVWPAPARPSLVSDDALRACHRLASTYDTSWTTHLMDYAWDRPDPQTSIVDRLDGLGVLSSRLLAAHCLGLDPAAMRTLAARGVCVSMQTASLCYLGEKPARARELLRAGADVALGTDDGNLNDSVDMFLEMRLMTFVQRLLENDAEAISAEDALDMATAKGAQAIGMGGALGSIEVGKKADLITVRAEVPRMSPVHSFASSLVLQATSSLVETVVIDGRVVLHEGRPTFLSDRELTELCRTAQDRSTGIVARSGIGREVPPR
jgi:cytosine/adenosine deaminase-related metal-dependent hydrolase